jgi:ribonuclease VapC
VSNVNIIDASAALAYLNREKGHEIVDAALGADPSWITSVNYCEILGKLIQGGMPLDAADLTMVDLGLEVIDFDLELARLAAAIRSRTASIGASLGDRACLALAQRTADKPAGSLTPVVYTAEQSWAKVKWPFKIVLIRQGRNP